MQNRERKNLPHFWLIRCMCIHCYGISYLFANESTRKKKKVVNKTNWLNSKWCFKIDVTAYLLWCLMAAFDISYDDKKTKETIQAHDIMHSKQTKNVPKHQNSSPCMLRRQLVPASLSIAHKNAICYSSFFCVALVLFLFVSLRFARFGYIAFVYLTVKARKKMNIRLYLQV